MAESRPTLSYGVLLYPGFGVLDIAGPLEVLNTLSGMNGLERMTLSVLSKTMDPINLGSPGQRGVNFKSKQQYLPTHTFDNAPNIDVLLVPGGWGSLPPADTTAEVDFIRKAYRGDGCPPLQYLFTICTGSALAAQGMKFECRWILDVLILG
jgi:putative intracellular protease/amidase